MKTTTVNNATKTSTRKTSSGSSVSGVSSYVKSKNQQYKDRVKQKRDQIKNLSQRNAQEIERLNREIESLKIQNQNAIAADKKQQNTTTSNKILSFVGGAKDPSEVLAAKAIAGASSLASKAAQKIGGKGIALARNFIAKRLAKSSLNNSYDVNGNFVVEKCSYKKLKQRLQNVKEDAPTNNVGSGEVSGINPPVLAGIGKGSTVNSLARRHKVKNALIKKQLAMGKKVEKEHTKNVKTALKIATDHVYEDPKYYSKLKKMESRDIGNDTKFTKTDKYEKYRTPVVYTRKATLNKKPGEEKI